MDLSTEYLGIRLANPVIVGASPIADEIDDVRRLEDSGISAIVLRSLFEEQIALDQIAQLGQLDARAGAFAEALRHMPESPLPLGPDGYARHLARVKKAVDIPVIASLNGSTPGGWLRFARTLEHAGADALEINMHEVCTDVETSASEVENRLVETVAALAKEVRFPIAVKLSQSFTALPHLGKRLSDAGARGLVLFNRFYQPDIDPETLGASRSLALSTSAELLPRLHWIAILSGRVPASLAASGGVHTAHDVAKVIMTGAHAVQVVSCVLTHGPSHVETLIADLEEWMRAHGFDSIETFRGSMNLEHCEQSDVFERVNYMEILQSLNRDQGSPG